VHRRATPESDQNGLPLDCSCNTRSNLGCNAGGMSPTSSKNKVPLSAISKPDLLRNPTGKGTFLMTEQFAFQKIQRNGRATKLYQSARAALTSAVNDVNDVGSLTSLLHLEQSNFWLTEPDFRRLDPYYRYSGEGNIDSRKVGYVMDLSLSAIQVSRMASKALRTTRCRSSPARPNLSCSL
jgi:hypothetical protein